MPDDIGKVKTQLAAILDASPDLFLALTENGTIEYVNPQVEKTTGLRSEDCIGRPFALLVPGSQRKGFCEWWQWVRKGTPGRCETEIVKSDGTVLPCLVSSSSLAEGGGFLLSLKDLTDRKKAERSLRISHHFLEMASRHHSIAPLLKDFVRGVQAYSECGAAGIRILDEDEEAFLYQEYAGYSHWCKRETLCTPTENGGLCVNVIGGETGSRTSSFTKEGSFYVNDLSRHIGNAQDGGGAGACTACSSGYASMALIPLKGEHRILGVLHVADTRPGMLPLETVLLLEKAALQLCVALQRIREKEENMRMRDQIRKMQWGETIGALAGEAARDFNDLLTALQGHAGLSLANGEQGDIPYRLLKGIQRSSPRAVEAPQRNTKSFLLQDLRGNGERILLVEDSRGVRAFARRVFNENGYSVFEASSAEEAWEVFEREGSDFHLAFCDVALPDTTALHLVDRLLTRKPSLKVLLSSGCLSEKPQWNAIRQRRFRLLQKPYTLSELLLSVKEALQAR